MFPKERVDRHVKFIVHVTYHVHGPWERLELGGEGGLISLARAVLPELEYVHRSGRC